MNYVHNAPSTSFTKCACQFTIRELKLIEEAIYQKDLRRTVSGLFDCLKSLLLHRFTNPFEATDIRS